MSCAVALAAHALGRAWMVGGCFFREKNKKDVRVEIVVVKDNHVRVPKYVYGL